MSKLIKVINRMTQGLVLNPKITFIHSFIQRMFIERPPHARHHVDADDTVESRRTKIVSAPKTCLVQ